MARFGKEAPEFMERIVYSSLGKKSPRIVVGPGIGLDNGVVSLGRRRVMVFTVDPVSVIPSFGMKLSAWLSVHLIASDYTTSGLSPEFATFSYNFPPTMSPSDKKEYLQSIGRECERLGVSIVGGHTGIYPGAGFTVVGACSMFGFGSEGDYVTSSMSSEGDSVMMTKHAAIEATASLALSFPDYTEDKVGRFLARRARRMISSCSTVLDATIARKVGLGKEGVTSMHDATEGGVLGALDEMAKASGKSFVVDAARIPVSAEAKAVCSAFGIDPLASMGEGALLVTCRPERIPELRARMSKSSIPIEEIGKVMPGTGLHLSNEGGPRKRYKPGRDGYWEAYDRATRLQLG